MRWSPEEEAWLSAHYGESDAKEVTRDLNERFGRSRSVGAVLQKANEMGLSRPMDLERRRGADRVVRWSSEPEMAAFMRDNDKGSRAAVIRKFQERFGIRLTPEQVSAYRAFAGTQSKKGRTHAQDWHRVPVGTERVSKGYVVVKVQENPSRPGSKDNWRLKQVVAWEKANGMPVPAGHMVMFADRDRENFDPENLVAVPRCLIGAMNGGPKWHDRESLEAAVALARLRCGLADAVRRGAVCGVCGREFEPDLNVGANRQRTCRECLDKGLRSPKDYGVRTCPQCGRSFRARSARSEYCSVECRSKAERMRRKARREKA